MVQVHTFNLDGSFNILQMDYVFKRDVSEMAIPITIYDDDILNGDRSFFLDIPALSLVYRGGLRAMAVAPYYLQAHIQDDEGIINTCTPL